MKEVRSISKPEIHKAGSQQNNVWMFSAGYHACNLISFSLKEVAPMVLAEPPRSEEMGADKGF